MTEEGADGLTAGWPWSWTALLLVGLAADAVCPHLITFNSLRDSGAGKSSLRSLFDFAEGILTKQWWQGLLTGDLCSKKKSPTDKCSLRG